MNPCERCGKKGKCPQRCKPKADYVRHMKRLNRKIKKARNSDKGADEGLRDKTLLRQLQSLPLRAKILMTQQRIREWYDHFGGDVCVSFSGGKDSTVLAHIVHEMHPKVPLIFADTGLEYPEIRTFAKEMGAEFVRPKMIFSEVISRYGYPIISKEVAEAIHFARRIITEKTGENAENVDITEREREREYRQAKTGENPWNERRRRTHRKETDRQRSDVLGTWEAPNCTHSIRTEQPNGDGRTLRTAFRTKERRRILQARRWLMGK